MTLLRKLATQISAAVVRCSSAAAKDWAAATAQELAFIESDWDALRWSLGSARLLLHQRCEVPLASVAGVPAASDGLFRQTAGRARGACYLASVMALCLAHSLAHLHDPVRRTGCYILIAAILYTVYQVIARRGRRMPPNADLTAQTAHYRSQLLDERGFYSGPWLWSRLILVYGGLAVSTIAGSIVGPAASLHRAALIAGSIVGRAPLHRAAFWMVIDVIVLAASGIANYRKAAEFQRRIEDLDSIERGAS
jgi:hypothetical protein